MSLGEIIILIDSPLESISEIQKNSFIDDLSIHAGVEPEVMVNPIFRSGCTIFRAKFDAEAVRHLIDVFENSLNDDLKNDKTGFLSFLEKYEISLITGTPPGFGGSFNREEIKEEPIVIFIHGWRGDKKSFGRFPELIKKEIGLNAICYEYPTGIWKKSPHIYFLARNLDNWLRNNVENRPLIFIVHSMGGLVLKKLITAQHYRSDPLDVNMKSIAFIASPHAGTSWAKLADYIPAINKVQLDNLKPSSPILMDINEQWFAWSNRNIPSHCYARNLYGTEDKVVPINSAIANDPEAIPILGKGHVDIVKPKTRDDEVLKTSCRIIKESGLV